jgi:predicted DNA-binding transcriptional regulator YafY
VALDLQDRRLKTYRIDKIEKVIRSNDSEYISSDFESDIEPLLEKFRGDLIKKIIIRADAQLTEAHRLIRKASSVEKIDGSLLLTFYNVDSHEITEMILWSGSLVEVISPNFLRESIYQALTRTFQANT